MAVEALAGLAKGVDSPRVVPNERKPVNEEGKVSVNRTLELSKGDVQTIDKSVSFGSESLKERLTKLDNSPSNFAEAKVLRQGEDSNPTKRKLFDDSVQEKIFDSEKFEQRLQRSVQTLNQRMEELNRSVRFSVDRVLDKDIISVVNPDSGEVIRQIPPETAMKVSEGVASLRGMLFDEKA
jgi:flagellar protein FlaG